MELVTLGRAAVPPAPTPIREGRTRLRKCCGSFAITLRSDATPKLRIARALDELGQQVDDHLAFALRVCVVPHNFLSKSSCPLGSLVLGELFCGKRCAG